MRVFLFLGPDFATYVNNRVNICQITNQGEGGDDRHSITLAASHVEQA